MPRSALQVDPSDRLTVLAAELTSDDGWAEAVAGRDGVLHALAVAQRRRRISTS